MNACPDLNIIDTVSKYTPVKEIVRRICNWFDNVCIIIGPDISCERSNNNPICAEIKPTEIRQITFLESFYYD